MAGNRSPAEPLRVVIAGGGTGGHLYPGIAVARELIARVPDAVVSFAGTAKGIEARVVPREGFALDVIRSGGLKGKSLTERARGLGLLPVGGADAWALLSRRRPHLVIGVGGYSSGPVVALAALRGIPTLLLEQNAVPGLTNRTLAPLVRAAAVTFDATLPYFKGKGFVSGNPVRSTFLDEDAAVPRDERGAGGSADLWRFSGGARDQRGRSGGSAGAGTRRHSPRRHPSDRRARSRDGPGGLPLAQGSPLASSRSSTRWTGR